MDKQQVLSRKKQLDRQSTELLQLLNTFSTYQDAQQFRPEIKEIYQQFKLLHNKWHKFTKKSVYQVSHYEKQAKKYTDKQITLQLQLNTYQEQTQQSISKKDAQINQVHSKYTSMLNQMQELCQDNLQQLETTKDNCFAQINKQSKLYQKEIVELDRQFGDLLGVTPQSPLKSPKFNLSSVAYTNESNVSAEFDELIENLMPNNTTDPVGISMDKTIGGWNSEYESEADNSSIVNTEEIKNAIRILSKANLFSQNFSILQDLSKVSYQNEEDLELMLQLINISKTNESIAPKKPILKKKVKFADTKYTAADTSEYLNNTITKFLSSNDINSTLDMELEEMLKSGQGLNIGQMLDATSAEPSVILTTEESQEGLRQTIKSPGSYQIPKGFVFPQGRGLNRRMQIPG